ncbi:putative sensor-like histidine kinase [compost metagenome]
MKLLLQPIVENAILHAFDPGAKQQGLLSIRGHISDHVIIWTVQDNGCGMSTEQVDQLLHIPVRSKGGYGLRNVNERLQMMFGPPFALQIVSNPGHGTTVTVRIPIIQDEEQWRRLYEDHGH